MRYFILVLITIAVIAGIYSIRCWSPRMERPSEGKKHILCIGDSITFGAGVVWTRWKDSYPAVLGRLLGKDHKVLNYGISGATAIMTGDNVYPRSFIAAGETARPEICLFMLGTNDSKPHCWDPALYDKALDERIDSLAVIPKIILMLPPKAFSIDGKPVVYGIRDEVIHDEIIPIIKKKAEDRKLSVIDLYTPSQTHPEWFRDGVHPNAAGNKELAKCIFNALNDYKEDHYE